MDAGHLDAPLGGPSGNGGEATSGGAVGEEPAARAEQLECGVAQGSPGAVEDYVAPATFAGFAAATRFAAGALTRVSTTVILEAGAVVALLGTCIVSVADGVPVALVGIALAATGSSVLFPTLLSRAVRDVPADRRGAATAAVATTAYLGFLWGPVYVGALANSFGLRGAMMGVALLPGAFAVLAPLVTRGRKRRASGGERVSGAL